MLIKAHPSRLWKCTFGMTVIMAVSGMVFLSLKVPLKHFDLKNQEMRNRLFEDTLVSSRWIVTSHLTAEDVINVRGWTILLYEDTENQNCRWPRCILLKDVLSQDSRVASMAQTSRELSAYIYAISRGAKHICRLEKWNINTEEILSQLTYTERTSGIVLTNISRRDVMESSDGLHSKDVPLNYFHQYSTIQRFVIENDIKPSIRFPVHFAGDIDIPVYIPSGKVVSLFRNVVIFRYDAFWALALRNIGKVSSQFIQKILWLYGGYVGMQPVKSFEFMRQNFQIIDKNIDKFTCEKDFDIHKCIERLIQEGIHRGWIGVSPTKRVRSYLETLANLGYDYPNRNPSYSSKEIQTRGSFKTSTVDNFPQNTSAENMIHIVCPKVTLSPPQNPIKDIGLIVTFNIAKLYKNIPGIEAMYRPYFKHILYCGPNLTHFELTVGTFRMARYVFIEAFKLGWYYMYECTTEALKLNLKVNGFLQIGDDTLVNPWVIRDFPRHSFWLNDELVVANINTQLKWAFWDRGRTVFGKLISFLQTGINRNEMTVKNFLHQFARNSANFTNMFTSRCDFMYAPTKFKDEYIALSQIFKRYGVMTEIAYASLVMGLQKWDSIHFVENGNLVYPNKSRWRTYYTTDKVYMHPFKLGRYLRFAHGRRILCGMYFTHKD